MQHDVLIAGGGAVGAAMAAALHQAGFDTALVERAPPPPPFDPALYDPRVYAISPASVGLLRRIGAWDAIQAQRACAYSHMRVWDADPQQGLEFDAGLLRAPELGYIVENRVLVAALWGALAGVTVHTCTAIAGATCSVDRASLRLADGRELQAHLLVAADGADSPLRRELGIEVSGWSYPQQAVVCHVSHEKPHRGTAFQRFLPDGPLAFLPLADGRSSIVWSTTSAAELLALDDAAFGARLGAALQFQLGTIGACTPRLSFPLRLLHAQDYALERFVLAGDAAHVIHPLAGQGVNLGLADVAALVQRLAAARDAGRDIGGLRVLRGYGRERKAASLEMMAVTDALYRAFNLELPGWPQLLRTGMRMVDRSRLVKRELVRRAAGFQVM